MDIMMADLAIAMAPRSLMNSGKIKAIYVTSKKRAPICTADALENDNGMEEYRQEDRRNNP
jgi:hypothetical protein